MDTLPYTLLHPKEYGTVLQYTYLILLLPLCIYREVAYFLLLSGCDVSLVGRDGMSAVGDLLLLIDR